MNFREVMIEKTRVMLSMQDEMNSHVDSDWLASEREWYRALWIECAELMDHYGGWKWWQHSTPDYDQVMLEIVDIWHFGLSMPHRQRASSTAPPLKQSLRSGKRAKQALGSARRWSALLGRPWARSAWR